MKMEQVKRFIKADTGKCGRVIKYRTGKRVEIPINSDGSVRWYEDRVKKTVHSVTE
jgi:hypothetical protein